MKILHIIDHWGLGGAQRAVCSLMHQDREHEHEVVSLYRHRSHDWHLPKGAKAHFLARGYGQSAAIPLRLRSLIHRWRPDILHVHLNGSKLMTALALTGKRHRIPVIWHEHSGVELFHIYGRMLGGLLLFIQRRLLAGVAGVAANSLHTMKYCTDQLRVGPEKLRVIYCPVNDLEIREKASQPLRAFPEHASSEGEVVGFVGRLASQKGAHDFLNMARQLVRQRPSCQVWIVGDGRERAALEAEIKREGLSHHIIFWGGRNDVYTIMKKMSVIVMPSMFEPFGLVAVEAFILGKPVVAYDVDGLSEVLQMNALGVPVTPMDQKQLLEKTCETLQNLSRPAAIASPAETGYDSDKISSRWVRYYYEIAEGRA